MKSVNVIYSNGQTIETQINGTDVEILAYFSIGREFNIGAGPNDNMQKVVAAIIQKEFSVFDGYENVFGRPIPRHNAAFGMLVGIVPVNGSAIALDEMEVGQETFGSFYCSGVTRTYRIVRVA